MRRYVTIFICLLFLVGCGKQKQSNSNRNISNESTNSNVVDTNTNTSSDTNSSSNSNTSSNTNENEDPNVGKYVVHYYLFHLSTCPHCQEEIEWLQSIEKDYPYLQIHYYEVGSTNPENAELVTKVRDASKITGENRDYVPLAIIGNEYYIGFADSKERKFIRTIKEQSTQKYCDIVDTILKDGDVEDCLKQNGRE